MLESERFLEIFRSDIVRERPILSQLPEVARTTLADPMGGKTQLGGLIAVSTMVILLVFFTHY